MQLTADTAESGDSDTRPLRRDGNKEKFLLLSHSELDRTGATRVKQILEETGYNIAMYDNTESNALEQMSTIVQYAEAVVICLSSNYKLSSECQTE
eukprot:SAG11_NODE_12217_length_715_cov_0.918831_2_plen_95_part_01